MRYLRAAPVDTWHARGVASDLTADECWRRLAREHRGRIALSESDLPSIYSVDYVATDSALVFRTAASERLRRFSDGARIGFEVGVELETELWSVMLIGTARHVESTTGSPWDEKFPARPTTETYIYGRIDPAEYRGRVWMSPVDLDLVADPLVP